MESARISLYLPSQVAARSVTRCLGRFRGTLPVRVHSEFTLEGFHADLHNPICGCAMTADRHQLVQDSWETIEPNSVRLVELAVLHLVEITPALGLVIANHEMLVVCRSVGDIIGRLITTLDEPNQLVPFAVELGRSNPDLGISARMYPAMGEALVWALHLQLGDTFTAELQTAWVECYQLVSAIMRRGEQSRTGEFERYRTGEFAAYQNAVAREVRISG